MSDLRGWDAIAKRAKMSVKTARERARYGVEGRLPVFTDHKKHVIANAAEIDRWLADQIKPYGALPYGAELRPYASNSHELPRAVKKNRKTKPRSS